MIRESLRTPEAFGILFDRHFDVVFGYFARRIPRSQAADLASETFRIAFDSRARFDEARESARPWLYGIAGNVLRHHARSRGREQAAVRRLAAVPDLGETAEVGLIDSLDAQRRWPEVAAALDALAANDREALLLLAWEDLSYADIALATDVPIGTVRSRIHRARAQVRELIGDDGQLPDDRTEQHHRKEPEHG